MNTRGVGQRFCGILRVNSLLLLGVLGVALLCASAAVAQTLTVVNADGHSTTLTAAQIAGAAHVTVSVYDHGVAAKFEGVPLATVLTIAGIQLGDSLRGARLTEVLLASAADGYKVAYALAEVDPAFAAMLR